MVINSRHFICIGAQISRGRNRGLAAMPSTRGRGVMIQSSPQITRPTVGSIESNAVIGHRQCGANDIHRHQQQVCTRRSRF